MRIPKKINSAKLQGIMCMHITHVVAQENTVVKMASNKATTKRGGKIKHQNKCFLFMFRGYMTHPITLDQCCNVYMNIISVPHIIMHTVKPWLFGPIWFGDKNMYYLYSSM